MQAKESMAMWRLTLSVVSGLHVGACALTLRHGHLQQFRAGSGLSQHHRMRGSQLAGRTLEPEVMVPQIIVQQVAQGGAGDCEARCRLGRQAGDDVLLERQAHARVQQVDAVCRLVHGPAQASTPIC